MASYQEIDTRLEGVENALMWMMKEFFKVQRSKTSPLDLNPQVETVSLLQHYREEMARGLAKAIVEQIKPEDLEKIRAEVEVKIDGTDTE